MTEIIWTHSQNLQPVEISPGTKCTPCAREGPPRQPAGPASPSRAPLTARDEGASFPRERGACSPGPTHPAGATPGDESTISAVNLSSFSDCEKKKKGKL